MSKIIKSPLSGKIIPIEDVPDEVFARKMLGDGIAIIPDEGIVEAPVNGTLLAFPESGHACGIITEEGYEILVHIGIDTVEMEGKGFTTYAVKGEKVIEGQKLISFDIEIIQDYGKSLCSPVVISGSEIKVIPSGTVKRGEPLIQIMG